MLYLNFKYVHLMLKEAETLIESGAFKTKKSITKINASRIPSL